LETSIDWGDAKPKGEGSLDQTGDGHGSSTFPVKQLPKKQRGALGQGSAPESNPNKQKEKGFPGEVANFVSA